MKPGKPVEVLWDGGWQPAHVDRVWSDGADVVVGSHGCWYFTFDLIRPVRRDRRLAALREEYNREEDVEVDS